MDITNLITGGIDALTGGVITAAQQNAQVAQQIGLSQLQLQNSKALADYSEQKQMDIWNNTNYEQQVQHMQNAGINPALMYKGGGQGGQLGSGNVPIAPMIQAPDKTKGMEIAMQTAATQAQLEVAATQAEKNKADANLSNTQAKKLGGVDTANVGADTALKQAQADLTNTQATLQGKSIENQLSILNSQANIAINNVAKSLAEANIAQETQDAQIATIKQQATNIAIDAVAKEQNIKLDQAKINEITQGIQQKWQELNIKGTATGYEHNDRLKAIEEYTSNALKVAGIVAVGNVVRDVVGIATKQMPTGQHTTITDGQGNTTKEIFSRPVQ